MAIDRRRFLKGLVAAPLAALLPRRTPAALAFTVYTPHYRADPILSVGMHAWRYQIDFHGQMVFNPRFFVPNRPVIVDLHQRRLGVPQPGLLSKKGPYRE